jgi:glycosyltransferase involved in cell wall biosynthesis
MSPSTPLSRFARIRSLRRAFEEFRPDVVVAHADIPSAYARAAMVMGRKCAAVSVMHDASENEYGSGWGRRVERILTYFASAVVAVSPRAADNYRKNVRAHPHLEVIPNGVRVQHLREAERCRDTHRASLGLSENDVLILQVGRISNIKRQHLSIDAFAIILGTRPGLKLWLAGIYESAECLTRIKELIAAKSLGDSVKLLGGRKDVPELLAACDLFLMPSSHEAHSVALLEALSAGAPIIASNIPPFEFARDIPGITLLDPNDIEVYAQAIRDSLKDPRRYNRDVRDFSIEATAEKYMNLFCKVLKAD